MTSLAAFVMRGRLQALLVAVAGAGSMLFCWLSAAVVALVTLRKGAGQGLWLLLWAVLPALALWLAVGDTSPLLLLLGTTTLALVLRATVSLPLTLLAAVAVGVLSGVSLMLFASEFLAQLVGLFDEYIAVWEQQLSSAGEAVTLARPTVPQVAGMLATSSTVAAFACLLLARYWQAALYNPGGFGAEFRKLRFPPAVSSLLLLIALALVSLDTQLGSWSMVLMVPLMFAGLALVHARVHHKGQGSGWLLGFYVAWVLLDPVKLIVVGAAVADSWIDFRKRWTQAEGGDSA